MSSGVGVLEEEEGAEEAAEEVEADTSCVNRTELGSGSSMGRKYQDVSRSITEAEAAESIDGGEDEGAGKLAEDEDEEEDEDEDEEEDEVDEEEEVEDEEEEGMEERMEEEVVVEDEEAGSNEMTYPRLSRSGVGRK